MPDIWSCCFYRGGQTNRHNSCYSVKIKRVTTQFWSMLFVLWRSLRKKCLSAMGCVSCQHNVWLNTSVSNVAFNPIIMATWTDYSTIYTVLLRLKECMNDLGQQYTPVIFDMSLLAKALVIVWCNWDELQGIIPCEGGMHVLMYVCAGIRYLSEDAGLRHLLLEPVYMLQDCKQHIGREGLWQSHDYIQNDRRSFKLSTSNQSWSLVYWKW